MKHSILTATIAALLMHTGVMRGQDNTPNPDAAAFPREKDPAHRRSLGIVSGGVLAIDDGARKIITVKSDDSGKGKAVITIEVNGKKETREIDLGNATELKILTDKQEPAKVKRSTYLGVAPEELSEELAAQLPIDPGSGLLVRSVVEDSPAAAAGLQKNDVLVKLDDQPLTNPKQLQKLVASKKAGDTVHVVYFRRGQRNELDAKLAEHEEGPDAGDFQYFLNSFGSAVSGRPIHVPIDPLTFQKKIVIVDKDGNVLTKDDANLDQAAALKQLSAEVERMRDQAAVAQKKAVEAIHHAEQAAKEAAEIARKEAVKASEQAEQALRKLREQMDKQGPKEKEVEKEQ